MKFPVVSVLLCVGIGNGFVAPPQRRHVVSSFSSVTTSPPLHASIPDIMQEQWNGILEKLPTDDLTTQVAQELDGIRNNLVDNGDIAKLLDQVKSVEMPMLEELENLGQSLQTSLQEFVNIHPQVEPYYQAVQSALQGMDLPPQLSLVVSSVAAYWVVSSLLSLGSEPPPSKPYPLLKYDPISAKAYFDQRGNLVLQRGIQVGINSLQFGLNLAMDYSQKNLEENAEVRAVELAKLLTKLGPSFIKIGQSLSIRTDLLSPPYVRGLQTLQDQVPPFSSKVAYRMLEEEWGVPLDSVLKEISPEPVAAASLGQVYKATTLDGNEVAIKVQRPNIMNQIALDMHLLREVAPIAKKLFNLNTDTVGTVDAWGAGFVDELDYISEAQNAKTFTESIQTTSLSKVVFAPPVVDEWTTRKMLMTEWVDGERLDRSSSEDVTVLCSIAMNTYLTMMLETGLLHCDPHPGNLLRTTDGRLCILDWGMVTRLDKNLQLTLIEHMAHLTSADYAEIPKDLLLLGFIPPEKKDLIRDSGVVETLADIYGAWTKGGGAATINVNKVISQLQDLTATRGNLFQIPPYFAYIAKSFSVLEGIGLSNNAKYSIINECLPYVSKRLLTDNSSRAGGALNTFIFGPDKSNVDTRIIDYERVEQLVTGFGDYTTSASGALLASDEDAAFSKTALLENLSDQVLDLVLSEESTPIQAIVIEQFAKLLSSTSRSMWTTLRENSGTLPNGRTVLGTVVDPLGLWRTSPIVRMNDLDAKTIETTRNLLNLMQEQVSNQNSNLDLSTLSREEVLELSTMLIQKLWNRRVGIVLTGNRLANQLLTLTANKLEKGERKSLTIPTPEQPQKEDSAETVEEPNGPTTTTGSMMVEATPVSFNSPKRTSSRLESARQLLSEIENDTTSWSVPQETKF